MACTVISISSAVPAVHQLHLPLRFVSETLECDGFMLPSEPSVRHRAARGCLLPYHTHCHCRLLNEKQLKVWAVTCRLEDLKKPSVLCLLKGEFMFYDVWFYQLLKYYWLTFRLMPTAHLQPETLMLTHTEKLAVCSDIRKSKEYNFSLQCTAFR